MGQPLHSLFNLGSYLGAVFLAAALLFKLGATTWLALPLAFVLAFPLLLGIGLILGPMLDKLMDFILFGWRGNPASRSKK